MRDETAVRTITASEINQHTFCARGWWLGQVKGYPSAHVREMAGGRVAHHAHGRIVVRYHRLQRLAYMLLAASVGALGIYLLARGS